MRTSDQVNDFISAAMTGDLQKCQKLNQKGYSVNLQDMQGETALCEACRCGRTDVVRWLINNQADVNLGSDKGSPLYIAAYSEHHEIVEILLETSAYVKSYRTGSARLVDVWVAAAKGSGLIRRDSFNMVEWAADKVNQAFQGLPRGHYEAALVDHHVSEKDQKKLSDSWKRYEEVPECTSSARCTTM